MGLLELYDSMTKKAEETKVQSDQMAVIEEFAKLAEEQLKAEGKTITADEIAVRTDSLIQEALAVEEMQQKVAELDESGRVMARAFWDEYTKLASTKQ
jgi:hypothetical protein